MIGGKQMGEAKGPAIEQPYIKIEEQRVQKRVERAVPILPAHRDVWVLIGLIILLVEMFLLIFLWMAGFLIPR